MFSVWIEIVPFSCMGINRFSKTQNLTRGSYQCLFQVEKSDKMAFSICHKGTKAQNERLKKRLQLR
jgi:hypothetical protein